MRSTALERPRRGAQVTFRWPSLETWPLLLLGAVLAGCALVLATTEIGSGDYGQWLMTARPYLGESVPDYRAASAVPPVMPYLLSVVVRLAGDPMAGVHLFSVLLLLTLGGSAYLAAATFFGGRWAGLLAVVGALLLTDRFLDLFAFGGLLQAGAIVLLWLGAAALVHAGQAGEREWLWWRAGGACIGLAALTHVGTASIIVPTGIAVGFLSAMRVAPTWRPRLRRLAPLAVALAVVAAYWFLFLLPGGAEIARNPASLTYRGPGRLVDGLTAYWPAWSLVGLGAVGMAFGVIGERLRHAIGAWTIVAAWCAVTLAVVLVAVLTGAATDYPRFATPLLAPLVVAAAGAAVTALRVAGAWLSRQAGRGTPVAWSVSLAIGLVAVSTPTAVVAFSNDALGYRMADSTSLQQAATWIEGNLPAGATILSPVREGKWIEGLSGRAALFSAAVRYSFRPDEWRRSLAADTVLRSGGALTNDFFFTRFTDDVANASVPRGMAIGVNHGGEYLDLLKIVASGTRVLDPSGSLATVATLTNLDGAGREVTGDGTAVSVASTWSGERRGAPVTYRQIVSLRSDSSTLELRASAATQDATGFELQLRPAQVELTAVTVAGGAAALTFAQAGSSAPHLRVVLAGASGTLEPLAGGGLLVRSAGGPIRLLITDLTGAGSAAIGAQFLDPAVMLDAYDVGGVLLVRDPSFEARRTRLETLGFHVAQTFGAYVVMVSQ